MTLSKHLKNWNQNMNSNDYRYTIYENKNLNIPTKKQAFIDKLNSEHPRNHNHYKLISENVGPYKLQYLKIFDNKCVYCGNSLDNIPITLFEIDHYINKASWTEQEEQANHVDNLYPACKICNSKKSGITFVNEYITIFNPVTNIQNIFYRDENYNIKIKEPYCSDPVINKFYDKLKLNHDTRRLDYLLLCMRGLAAKTTNSNLSKELIALVDSLHKKRNIISL